MVDRGCDTLKTNDTYDRLTIPADCNLMNLQLMLILESGISESILPMLPLTCVIKQTLSASRQIEDSSNLQMRFIYSICVPSLLSDLNIKIHLFSKLL